MKIRISGYQLTFHQDMNISTLFEQLQKEQGKRVLFSGHQRVLRVEESDGFVMGLLMTDRGYKNFVAMHKETNQISRGTIGEKKNFGAFSFFLLSKKKRSALITTYRDAGGPALIFG